MSAGRSVALVPADTEAMGEEDKLTMPDEGGAGALWDRWAATYDSDEMGLDVGAVANLADLAGTDGPALELGIGTGRIALPLAQRGIRVHGIDASPAMIARLLASRGDLPVSARIGDMCRFETDRHYDLIYIVASTFFLLTSVEQQISCLVSSARALSPSGRLVLETGVPGTPTLPLERNQMLLRELGEGYVKVSAIRHDRVQQTLRSQEIRVDDGGALRMLPMLRRYAYPSELDLMARLAGLRLAVRYGGWREEPFQADSARQISLYQLD